MIPVPAVQEKNTNNVTESKLKNIQTPLGVKTLCAALLALAPFIMTGCSLWADFTTYFNVYYNADEMFTEAESAIREQRRDPFAVYDAPLPGNASSLLDKVVEKCSKILQFSSQSNLVDDALMMLGRSFYYQRNFIKAQRKFQELISTQSESSLILEAQLWLAKTELQMKNVDAGLQRLDDVQKLALELGEDEILADVYIEQIKNYIVNQDLNNAIKRCKDLLDVSTDANLNARTAYQLGEMYASQSDYTNAAPYYFSVFDIHSPTYELGFLSRLKYGKMMLFTEKYEQAGEVFFDLRSEEKYREYYDQVDFAFILSEIRRGNYDQAIERFNAFDTTYLSSVQSGNARYEIALLYERRLKQFDSAYVYHQKANSSQATADYLPLIRERSGYFTKYRALTTEFTDHLKMIEYAADTAKYLADSIAYFKTDSMRTVESDTVASVEENQRPAARTRLRSRDFDFETEQAVSAPTPQLPVVQDTVPKGPPPRRPTISLDSIKTVLAKDAYELGNLFFTSLDVPDSAEYYYQKTIRDYHNSPYEANALYSLANLYLSRGDTLHADSLYRAIYDDYKSSRIVNEAAKRLKLPEIDFDYDPAKKLYAEAEKLLLAKQYQLAYDSLTTIYKNHPKSSYAPKAHYACAFILEEHLKLLDSAAVLYDSITVKHPSSAYAVKAAPKLSYYKQEKERIAAHLRDSLRHIQDSIAALRDTVVHSDTVAVRDSLAGSKPAAKQGEDEQPPQPPQVEEEKPPQEENPDENPKKKREETGERERLDLVFVHPKPPLASPATIAPTAHGCSPRTIRLKRASAPTDCITTINIIDLTFKSVAIRAFV